MSVFPQGTPQWLLDQKILRRGESGYLNRRRLIRRYAEHLIETGREVSFADIRLMLEYLERGYSLEADQISSALAPLYRAGKVAKISQGVAVSIAGTSYPSSRSAAEAFGISPQTVLNRIRSSQDRWDGWRFCNAVPIPVSCPGRPKQRSEN